MFLEIYKAVIAAYLTIRLDKIAFIAVMGVVARIMGIVK